MPIKHIVVVALTFVAVFTALTVAVCAAAGDPVRACPTSGQPVTHGIVAAGAVRIEVLAQGRGPTVLMIPSLGRGAEDFDAVADCLAGSGFRVLRPQPRGVARSTGPLAGLTLRDYAGDLIAVLEGDGKPAIVIGHAFGGFVARMLATERPDLVRGIVLAASDAGYRGHVPGGAYPGSAPPEVREAIQKSGDLSLPDDARLRDLQLAFFAPGHDPQEWLKGWHPEALAAETAALKTTPVDAYFWSGNARILDIEAQRDAVANLSGGVVLDRMLTPRVTIVIVPDAGHALFPEQPLAVGDAIVTFARGLPSP